MDGEAAGDGLECIEQPVDGIGAPLVHLGQEPIAYTSVVLILFLGHPEVPRLGGLRRKDQDVVLTALVGVRANLLDQIVGVQDPNDLHRPV